MSKVNCKYCECILSKSYFMKHLKTKKHLKNIKFNENKKVKEYIICSICLEDIKIKKTCKKTNSSK